MNVTARSYLTAGVAAIGAGAMALTPIQATPTQPALTQERAVSTLAVNLAATIDPITPWVNTFNAAVANAKALNDAFWAKPFPVLQTIMKNQFTYLSELSEPSLIVDQVFANIPKFFNAPFVASKDNMSRVATGTPLPINHPYVWDLLPRLLPAESFEKLKPILDFTTTPISGALAGFAGPGLGATLQFIESVKEIFTAPDFTEGLNAFLNLPANVVNVGLNGGKFFDLGPVLKALGLELPSSVKSFGLSTGGVLNGGGVAFDSVDTEASLFGLTVHLGGIPVGLLGSMLSTSNFVSKAIVVTPPAPTPPKVAAAIAPAAAAAVEAPTQAPAQAPAEVSAPAETSEAPKDEAPTLIAVPEDDDQTPAGVQTLTPQDDPAPSTGGGTGHRGGGSGGDNGGGAAKKSHRGA